MKKFSLGILTLVCVLVFGFTVLAAGGSVTAVSAAATTTSVTVSGTTTGVNAAVAVQVLDSTGNVLAMETLVVLGDAYSGTLTNLALTAEATYTVRVADYDGGDWKTTTVTVPAAPAAPATPATPATPAGAGGAGGSGAGNSGSTEAPQERVKDDVPKTGDPVWEVWE